MNKRQQKASAQLSKLAISAPDNTQGYKREYINALMKELIEARVNKPRTKRDIAIVVQKLDKKRDKILGATSIATIERLMSGYKDLVKTYWP